MPLYDVTIPLAPGMPLYPGDPPVTVEQVLALRGGDPYNMTRLSLGTHAGTHVDAPAHFFEGGGSVDEIPLEVLWGPAQVVEVASAGEVPGSLVRALDLPARARVLFKTRSSALWRAGAFQSGYVSLSLDAARALVDRGVLLVGIDYLSVEAFGAEGAPVHRALLAGGVVILEGLDLSGVPPGPYELVCLPLRVRGAEGAPARVLLKQ